MNQLVLPDAPLPRPSRLAPSERRRPVSRHLCAVAATLTAAAFALPVGELIASSRRSAYTAFARQCAMYLAHVSFGLSYSEVACGFGRDRTTAAHACRLVEERRDDGAVEAVLGSLEQACAALHCRLGARVRS